MCVQQKTPNDVQRNCPKHVEFYSKNKFEKLVHLFDFIIRTGPPQFMNQYVHSCVHKSPTLASVLNHIS